MHTRSPDDVTVTNQGKMRWMIIDETFNSNKLSNSCKGCRQESISILGNLQVHHRSRGRAWLAEPTSRIKVFYLPRYNRELNLEERLNADLKEAGASDAGQNQSQAAVG